MQIFRTMHDFQEQCQTVVRATMCLSISIFLFKTMYNKKIIKFGFCDIRFNQGLSKCYQPWRSLRFIRPTQKYRKICGKSQQKAKINSDILRIINPLLFFSAPVPREGFISYEELESYGFISEEIRCLLTNTTRKRDLKMQNYFRSPVCICYSKCNFYSHTAAQNVQQNVLWLAVLYACHTCASVETPYGIQKKCCCTGSLAQVRALTRDGPLDKVNENLVRRTHRLVLVAMLAVLRTREKWLFLSCS